MDSSKHTLGPWTIKDWAITGPEAAADMVAQDAVKNFDESIGFAIVAQVRDVGKKLVATTYGASTDHATANAAFIVRAVNSHEPMRDALRAGLNAIDILMAQLIAAKTGFVPTQSPVWPVLLQIKAALETLAATKE